MAEKTETGKGARAPLELSYSSKTALPVRRSAIVRRQRLIDALADAASRRVTVVTAPAGYGKTTLLFDFAHDWAEPVCWYAMDERDRDTRTFLRYFLAACQRQFPGFGPELSRALEADELPPPEQIVDLMVASMEGQPQPFVLILDDFHFLDDAEELREIVDGWLYRLPPHTHVVLAGRTQPQLSTLPLMSVRQEVVTITAPDFAFRCEEVSQLCREVLGKEVPLDDAQHLADLTEGWAGALVLLLSKAQSAYRTISLEQLKGSDTLFRYIDLEQFQPLSADLKTFLTGSAVLRPLDEQTLAQLLGATDVEEKLNVLEQLNLLVPDGERRRYHRLFRAFLVSYLRAREPQRFLELNLNAASLMEQAEQWEEAVYHCIQASAWERVVSIAERVGWRLFEEGRWDTLADWLEAVPAEELAAQPKLILWKARILHYLNQVDAALALLAQAITALEAKNDWIAVGEALITKGMCLRVKGDYQESKEVLTRARGLLLKNDGPMSAHTEARKQLGITLAMAGELEPSMHELKPALDVYEAQGDTFNIAYVSEQLGNALMDSGRLSEAQMYLERAGQRWAKVGNDERLTHVLNNLGALHYLRGDYDQAEEVLRQGLAKATARSLLRWEVYMRVALADIRRDKGDYAAAAEMYNEVLQLTTGLDEAFIRIYILDAMANTNRLMGDMPAAERFAELAEAEARERGGVLKQGIGKMTRGLIERDRGDTRGAVTMLEEAAQLLKETSARRELATAYFLLAGVYFSLKRKRMALDYLEMSAKLVNDLGYDHFLQIEAARNPLLVQYAAANKLADGYFERLLKVIRPMRTAQAPARAPMAVAAEEEEAPEADGAALQAFAFGKPRVEIGGREITDLEWRSEKSKEMFLFFLCNRRPLRKEEIVAALWPDLPEDKTTSAFHSNMYRLRKALYADVIAKNSGRYILDPRGQFSFDVEQYQQLLQQADAVKGTPDAVALMEKAVALYKGQFAPDFYSEWAQSLRWQLEEQYMSLLGALAAAYSQAKEYKRAADVCQRILELDEYNEAAWYRLMASYIHSGQMEAAKYCYNRYVQVLSADEMEDEVPEFDELCREIRDAG